ncbi:uncharacterized protein LOC127706625 [Mytilus californianus]|uniref:uncharacterized protein LOC127706625 n=1 Tax=Mytilus californianus TaxID=6549 RepID=UPI0022456023|nr:uncharacterized protein LOC127706625 [Mytilus californianus]
MNDEQCNRFEGIYAGAVNGWNHKGQKESLTVMNVIRLEFSVYDLAGENMFLLNLNISVCLEVEGSCLIHIPIFKNTKLPKYQCNWSKNLNSKGFSLEKFKLENDIFGTVKGVVSTRLLEELGIAKYLKEEQCNRLTSPFSLANSNGWNDECKRLQRNTLPKLKGPISCYLTESCTHVECCIFVTQINRTVSLFLDINACNYQMSVGIETLIFRKSLLHYEFGKTDMFRMGNVVGLKYNIEDLKGEHMFLLNMDLSVCFETEGSCVLKLPLFREALLPKPVCDLDQGFPKLGKTLKLHVLAIKNLWKNFVTPLLTEQV